MRWYLLVRACFVVVSAVTVGRVVQVVSVVDSSAGDGTQLLKEPFKQEDVLTENKLHKLVWFIQVCVSHHDLDYSVNRDGWENIYFCHSFFYGDWVKLEKGRIEKRNCH